MNLIEQSKDRLTFEIPQNLLLWGLLLGIFIPVIARFNWIPIHGWDWMTSYLWGSGFFLYELLVLSAGWYFSGKLSKKAPLAFWFSVAGGIAFLFRAIGTVNIRTSSTAGVELMLIPIMAVIAIFISWAVGYLLNFIFKSKDLQILIVGIAGLLAIFYGTPLRESHWIINLAGSFWELFFFMFFS